MKMLKQSFAEASTSTTVLSPLDQLGENTNLTEDPVERIKYLFVQTCIMGKKMMTLQAKPLNKLSKLNK